MPKQIKIPESGDLITPTVQTITRSLNDVNAYVLGDRPPIENGTQSQMCLILSDETALSYGLPDLQDTNNQYWAYTQVTDEEGIILPPTYIDGKYEDIEKVYNIRENSDTGRLLETDDDEYQTIMYAIDTVDGLQWVIDPGSAQASRMGLVISDAKAASDLLGDLTGTINQHWVYFGEPDANGVIASPTAGTYDVEKVYNIQDTVLTGRRLSAFTGYNTFQVTVFSVSDSDDTTINYTDPGSSYRRAPYVAKIADGEDGDPDGVYSMVEQVLDSGVFVNRSGASAFDATDLQFDVGRDLSNILVLVSDLPPENSAMKSVFNSPVSKGIPAGGLEKQVLTKATDDDHDVEWEYPIPEDGAINESLVKASATNQDAVWKQVVPNGGAINESLRKASATNQDFEWALTVPNGGDEGQVLAKATDDDQDFEWIDSGNMKLCSIVSWTDGSTTYSVQEGAETAFNATNVSPDSSEFYGVPVGTQVLVYTDPDSGTSYFSTSWEEDEGGVAFTLEFDSDPVTGEEAETDTWEKSAPPKDPPGPVHVPLTTRVIYNPDGNEQLYGYMRTLIFDSQGRLVEVTDETRYTINEPEDCA